LTAHCYDNPKFHDIWACTCWHKTVTDREGCVSVVSAFMYWAYEIICQKVQVILGQYIKQTKVIIIEGSNAKKGGCKSGQNLVSHCLRRMKYC
jgi:hypothetical protein